jgi:hypothetical protein
VTADEALDHPFFRECDPHEFDARFLPRMTFPELHGTAPQCTRVAFGGRRNYPVLLSRPERLRPPPIAVALRLRVHPFFDEQFFAFVA